MVDLIERYAVSALIQNSGYDLEYRGDREAMVRELEEIPAAKVEIVKHSRWDLLVSQAAEYRWEAAAECPLCGFMKHQIWAGYFPDVPAATARAVTTHYAQKVRLPNYCENCGAKMTGGPDA